MISGSRSLIKCPLCRSRRVGYAFSRGARRANRCGDCKLLFLDAHSAGASASVDPTGEKARTFAAQLARYLGRSGGKLLVLGAPPNTLPLPGFTVTHAQTAQSLDPASFDVCVLWHSLENHPDPLAFLRDAHGVLKPAGCLAIATPTLDILPPALPPQLFSLFDAQTIQTALFFSHFHQAIVEREHASVQQPGGDLFVFSRATELREKRVLSVVIPAFNEAATIDELLRAVLAKTIPDLDLEIVLVESNSTDGTRDIVRRYADHPRVKLILEDRPRGKGFAVRTGLAHATGDFILIQDADLEYDLEDYDALVEPLAAGREAFVLGSRHSGSVWKMRQFAGQAALSSMLNLGDWFFTTLVNVLFGQRLKDPFTMFKVFRRDCLFGLRFQCNRFDFDYELLIKLLRKGYQPIELPVNYRSRSFKEGKKVSLFGDPLSWVKACLKLRFVRIDPLAEIEDARELAPSPAALDLTSTAAAKA